MTKCRKLKISEHTQKSKRFLMKIYPHFNPEVHKIESKIATVRTSHHCKYNINYHIIWIPKYRKPILTGKNVEVLKAIIEGQCQELGIYNLALEIMPDHLHLFLFGFNTRQLAAVSLNTETLFFLHGSSLCESL